MHIIRIHITFIKNTHRLKLFSSIKVVTVLVVSVATMHVCMS